MVLVTGAGGFIGSHLVDALTKDGIHVRAMLKPGEGPTNLSDDSVEIIYTNLSDKPGLEKAVAGMDEVYHLGAIPRYIANIPDQEYRDINIKATADLLEVSEAAKVKSFLYTATIEAVGISEDGKPLTESSPQFPRNIYGLSKMEGERLVRNHAAGQQMKAVVVRPPMTYGPRDPVLVQRLFGLIQKGFYPLVGDGKALTEFCYVLNMVQGMRLAMEKGQPGQVYFISDAHSYSIKEVIMTIAQEMGVRLIMPRIPVPVAYLIGFTFEILGKVFRFHPFIMPHTGRPPFSRKTVTWTARSRQYVDISKARRELGYKPRYDLNLGIRATIEWYRQHGKLK